MDDLGDLATWETWPSKQLGHSLLDSLGVMMTWSLGRLGELVIWARGMRTSFVGRYAY